MKGDDFVGAKIALFAKGGGVLTLLRDDLPGLPWAGHWDLPGGGREGDERAEDCALREMEEEFGLRLAVNRLKWRQKLPSMTHKDRFAWLFGGHIDDSEISAIRFGDEGQDWQIMAWDTFLTNPKVIPAMRDRAILARIGLSLAD